MNIVQLHDRVRFWLDTVGSTRFESNDIDQAINNTINEIVDEKYDHSRLNHRGDSFQKTQRVRDELRDLIGSASNAPIIDDTTPTGVTPTTGVLTITPSDYSAKISTIPDDYLYLLALAITLNDVKYDCDPLTFDQKNVIQKNPYRRIKSGMFTKCYYNENDQGNITIYHPFLSTELFLVEMDYFKKPIDVFYGYEKGPSDTIAYGTPCIASLTPTVHNSITYKSGDTFTTSLAIANISRGLVVINWVDPQINGMLHEEVAKRAAANCLLTSGNFEKFKALKAEVLAT